MPTHVALNSDIIEVSLSGTVDLSHMLDVARQVAVIENDSPVSPHRVTTVNPTTELLLNFMQMEELAGRRRDAGLRNPVRSAIIVANPTHYGFARMFQTLNNNPLIELQIFNDRDAALHWLRGEHECARSPSQ